MTRLRPKHCILLASEDYDYCDRLSTTREVDIGGLVRLVRPPPAATQTT